MKKQKIDASKLQELSIATENLHHMIDSLGENLVPVLCELLVNLSLRDVFAHKGYPDSYEICLDYLIDATKLSVALVANIENITKH